jgi:hypothetical protein
MYHGLWFSKGPEHLLKKIRIISQFVELQKAALGQMLCDFKDPRRKNGLLVHFSDGGNSWIA